MRITVFLLLASILQTFANDAYSQKTRLSLDFSKTKLVDVFDEIEERSEFFFLYNEKLVDTNREVNASFENQEIDKILDILFEGTDVVYTITDRKIILAPDYLSEDIVQQNSISGTITDEQGLPLPNVTVVIKGSTQGTVTNMDGNYSISDIPDNATLVFSFVGMLTQEVVIGNQTTINVTLEIDAIGIEEVVAIGYGTQSRQHVTSSISSLKAESIEEIPVSNVASAMQGKVAGVNIYSQNFAPGSTPNIRIRGGSSISNSNSPLIIVDGLPRSMDDINPNDIETIDVLKDASSAAIYGARASNGVILIKTKRGKIRKEPEIIFESDLSFQEHHDGYPLVSGEEFIRLIRSNIVGHPLENLIYNDHPAGHLNDEQSIYTPRWHNDGESIPEGWKAMNDPINPEKTIIYQENDPRDLLFKTGFWQNYHLGINGGEDNIKYSGSIGYTSDNGVIVETGYERLSAISNVDINISDILTFSSGISYSKTHSVSETSWMNSVGRQLLLAPTFRIRFNDGTLVPGFNKTATLPEFWRETRDYDNYTNKLSLDGSLVYRPIKDLSISVNGNYYRRDFEDEYFEKANFFNESRNAYANQDLLQSRQLEAVASYTKEINNKHNLSLMTGFSDLFVSIRNMYLEADGGATDIIPTLNAAPNKIDARTTKTEESLLGMFFRVGYIYNNKYLFQGSLRRDGSSKFGSDNKWGYFPAFSAGWLVNNEPFMKSINVISNLKLRASYGMTGNNDIGLYLAQGKYNTTKYSGNAGIYATQIPNQNLGWERTKQMDIGFDLGFLDERFSLLFDYYSKLTDNLLFSNPLPNTSGFNSITTNIGEVKFYGVDINFNANIINTADLRWDARFIYSINKNTVVKLPDNGREKNRIGGYIVPDGEDFGGIAEGEPLYSILGYKVDYIIDNQEQAENAIYDQLATGFDMEDGTKVKGRKFPGDYEWVDRNGDGVINEYDQFVLGYSMPHTTGGIGNTFSWNGFTLDVFFDYALGHSVNDFYWRWFNGNGFKAGTRPTKYVLTDSWEKEGDSNTKTLPKFYVQDPSMQSNYSRDNDRRVWKLDYLCIREIKLAYRLPKSIISKSRLQEVKVFISGNTLLYITKDPHAKEVNPEWGTNDTRDAQAGYPPVRKLNFGFKITL